MQRIERGGWDALRLGGLRRVADALGARLQVLVSWNGEQLDRLVDAGHADLQNSIAAFLRAAGSLVAVEVSFNHYGDWIRGRSARAWLRRPRADTSGLLIYQPMTNARVVSVRKANRGQRVRHSRENPT